MVEWGDFWNEVMSEKFVSKIFGDTNDRDCDCNLGSMDKGLGPREYSGGNELAAGLVAMAKSICEVRKLV
jgi:hypothetical protein